MDYIRCIENLPNMNNWSNTSTYNNFANRGQVREWFLSMVDMENFTQVQLMWTRFKPLFRQEFAVQSNDKLIIEGLSNLAIKHGKTLRELINRITKMMVIIKESYKEYQDKVLQLHSDVNRGVATNTASTYLADHTTNPINVFKMNMFRVALPAEIRNIFSQQDQIEITLMRMYNIATMQQRESIKREENYDPETEEAEVATFQKKRQNWQGARPKTNVPRGNQGNPCDRSAPGDNSN
jgi:hypothetical protein